MMRLFNIKCITHRKQPVWVASVSQYPPNESSKLIQHANEFRLFKYLRYEQNMQHVLDVAFHDSLGSARFMAIKLKKTETDEVWHILEGAASHYSLAKAIIAADEDVKLRDLDSVMLAVCVRTQPRRDFRIAKVPASAVQMVDTELGAVEASRVLIDATMKSPYPPLSLPKKEFMNEALRIWQEEVELARAAVKGDYYRAGKLYSQRRRLI